MDKDKQTQSDKERRIQELIDALPVLTPEDEALYDKYGNLIGSPENLLFGTTEPKTTAVSEPGESQPSPPWLSKWVPSLTPFVAPWPDSSEPQEPK